MELLLVISTGCLCILSFFFGMSARGYVEPTEQPKKEKKTLNPMNIYREHKEKEEAKKEQEIVDTIAHNIDVYDGTTNGQKEIPR